MICKGILTTCKGILHDHLQVHFDHLQWYFDHLQVHFDHMQVHFDHLQVHCFVMRRAGDGASGSATLHFCTHKNMKFILICYYGS